MTKKTHFLLIVFTIMLFVNCKRAPLQNTPVISHLSDFESQDGRVSLTISGGKAPYTIQWSNQANDTVLTDLAAGSYFVTIMDAKKNILIDTIEITQPEWTLCVDIDGNSYKTATVANMVWMLENLRVSKDPQGNAIENMVYDNKEENAVAYGRLYTWSAAMNDSLNNGSQGICPDGWHIPSDDEWTLMIDNISTVDKEIPNIKRALDLAYAGFYNNSFNNIDQSVSFWTSTQANDNAWKVYFNKNLSKAFRYHEKKTNAISLRCVKNN